MPNVSEMTRPFFSHDDDARRDDKILKLFFAFRKLAKEMSKEELESFVPLGAYSIFWSILEYMHRNQLRQEDIELLSDDLRISGKYIKMVLEDFELFRTEKDYYISDRLIEDIDKVAEKVKDKSDAATKRWALSNLSKYYKEIFEQAPVLGKEEIEKYLEYYSKIENFKTLLPDILFTLKYLKFDNLPKFNPSINWLLTENHMGSLINGEYGKLKSWSDYKARKKAQEKAAKEEQEEEETPSEFDRTIENIDSKAAAIELLAKTMIGDGKFVNPALKPLMKKFDITVKEVKEHKAND